MEWPRAMMLPPQPDAVLDRFASLAAVSLQAPVAVVSLLGDGAHVLPGAVGLPAPWQQERSVGWTPSSYQVVATAGTVVAVDDVADGAASALAPGVADFGVRSWIGAPLRFSTGGAPGADSGGVAGDALQDAVWGVVCVMDHVPRQWSERDRRILEDLAAAAAAELRSRVLTEQAVQERERTRAAWAAAETVRGRSQLLLSLSQAVSAAESVQEVSHVLSVLLRGQLGVAHVGILLRDPVHERARFVDMSAFPAGTDPAWAEVDLRAATVPAARSITRGRAYFCDDLAGLRAVDPDLDAQGQWTHPGAVVTLPLRVAGWVVGSLVLVWEGFHDTSDPSDQQTWLALADFTAQTVSRVQLLSDRRSAAETLQRSMLTRLPEPDHLEIRAYYATAGGEQVGGDWYDAVVMPDGATTLVIGDVVGHDMAAAAAMGQLRSMTRTLAWAFEEPTSQVLVRVDQAMTGLHAQTLATCVLARIEQGEADAAVGLRTLRWSNAGHPPPVLLHPDGSTQVLDSVPDLLLGLDTDQPRHDHTHPLAPDSVLLLYTDGLIEHRGRSIEEGLADLRATLTRYAGLPLRELLASLATDLIGDDPDDDCALLVVRMHPEDRPRPPEAGSSTTDPVQGPDRVR